MKKMFKLIDLYSKFYQFTYKGKRKYKTVFGGVLTFISIILITIFTSNFGKDIIYRENPTVINMDVYLDNPLTTLFNYNTSILALYLQNYDNINPLEYNRYLTILPSIIQRINVNKTNIWRIKHLELEKCSDDIKKNYLKYLI